MELKFIKFVCVSNLCWLNKIILFIWNFGVWIMAEKSHLKLLMVATEYPPMKGGVGRYTYNLVSAIRKIGVDINVVSAEEGNGDYKGLSPFNKTNSMF